MKIRTLLLDDSPESRMAAETALAAFPDVEIAGRFSTGQALLDWLETDTAQLLFLDIELHQELGFSVARTLREQYPQLMVVFLTGHSSYAIDGYGFHPLDFLTKPIQAEKLQETIEEARRQLKAARVQQPAQLMFRLLQGYRILDARDIVCVERVVRKNILTTETEELRIANGSVKELEEMLSPHGFFSCHQSFIISLWRVESVRDTRRQLYEVQLRGRRDPVPVSRHRYEALLEGLQELGIHLVH